MRAYHEEILERQVVNGFHVELIASKNEDGDQFLELLVDGELEQEDFESTNEARHAFLDLCEELRRTPNWELQAQYDEAHGTVNGYAPHDYDRGH